MTVKSLSLFLVIWMIVLSNMPFIFRFRLFGWLFKKPIHQKTKKTWSKNWIETTLEFLVCFMVFLLTNYLVTHFVLKETIVPSEFFYLIVFLIFIGMAFLGYTYRFLYRS